MTTFPSYTPVTSFPPGIDPAAGCFPNLPTESHISANPLAWVPGRKQACSNCRVRKKKCDAKLPSCSLCIKHRAQCLYLPSKSASASSEDQFEATGFGNRHISDYDISQSTTLTADFPALLHHPFEESITTPSTPFSSAWDNGFVADFTHHQPIQAVSTCYNDRTVPQSIRQQYGLEARVEMEEIDTLRQPRTKDSDISPREHPLSVSGSLVSSPNRYTQSYSGRRLQRKSSISTDLQRGSHDGGMFQTSPPYADDYFRSDKSTGTNAYRESSTAATAYTTPMDTVSSASSGVEKNETSSRGSNYVGNTEDILPPPTHIAKLLDLFFSHYHHYLPCIHQRTFTNRVKTGLDSASSSPLLWVVLAVAVYAHPDSQLRALQHSWLARAHVCFDRNLESFSFPTQSLQSAVWITFHAYISADLTGAWFFLGKACRLASLIGFDRIDCVRSKIFTSGAAGPRDHLEREEQRKAVWALFFLDKYILCLTGFPSSIDDRQFHVNFPVDDEVFQASTSNTQASQTKLEIFTTDLTVLLNPTVIQKLSSKPSMNHIYRASVLLGRITVFHNHLHLSHDQKEYQDEFANLENITSLFCYALSRFSGNCRNPTKEELDIHCWLHALVQTCNILLFHPILSKSIPRERSEDEIVSGFPQCLDAVRHILGTFKDTASRSIDTLTNPFLISAYFLCCRLLTVKWCESHDQADRDDVDFIFVLTDRMGEQWAPLAKKFRKGMLQDLLKSPDEIRKMRVGNGHYLDPNSV